jgi:hypothetical protein
LIPVHPMRLHRCHVFASLRHDFISATSPTRRSGACETWVPTGPHRPGSQRSLSCGSDLPEAMPACKWAQRPYLQPGDLGRPWTALSRLRKTCRACGASLSLDHGGGAASRFKDREILSIITEGDLPKSVTDPDEGLPTSNGNPSPPAT